MPVVDVKNIRPFGFQLVKTLFPEALVNCTLLLEISATQEFIAIFQSCSVECVGNEDTYDVLRENVCDVIEGGYATLGRCRGFSAELFDLPASFVPL